MDPFTIGLSVLFVCTAIFFVVLFSFIFYWHLKSISFIIVPVIWTFEFFAIGFFVVALVSIIIQNMPSIIAASGI